MTIPLSQRAAAAVQWLARDPDQTYRLYVAVHRAGEDFSALPVWAQAMILEGEDRAARRAMELPARIEELDR